MTKKSRQDWIDQGEALLVTSGPASITVETIAKRLGVTKGGFYGYFADKGELIAAILDRWEEQVTVSAQDLAESQEADPGRRAFLASELTWGNGSGDLDTAIRSWAAHDAGVAERLRRVDAFRARYLRTLMLQISADAREADLRTVLAFTAAIGMRFGSNDAGLPERGFADAIEALTTPGTLDLSPLDTHED